MKLSPWMLTVAAFLTIALLAVGFLFKKLTAREVVEAPRNETRNLPMAISDIEPGTRIEAAHVGTGPVLLSEELSRDTLTAREGVIGRIAKERIPAATPMRGSQFYAPGDRPDLDVQPDKRAVTVSVSNDAAMLNGLLKVGQYVDVHMTVDRTSGSLNRNRDAGGDAMTMTLFEGVRVLAINTSVSRSTTDRGNNVTLELDSDQARIMLLANEKGSIALTYNPSGQGNGGVSIRSEEDRVTLQELLGISEPEEDKKPFMTEHYRGSGRGTLFFEDGRRVGSDGGNDASDTSPDATPLHNGNFGDFTTDTVNPAPQQNETTVTRQQNDILSF